MPISGLGTFFAQILDGFNDRGRPGFHFPRSTAFACERDVIVGKTAAESIAPIPFPLNFMEKRFTLANFAREELESLCGQLAKEIGIIFERGALERAMAWSDSQPWLASALAKKALLPPGLSSKAFEPQLDKAAKALIRKGDSHIDSLTSRLGEPRANKAMVIVGGDASPNGLGLSDFDHAADIGLLKRDQETKGFVSANGICGEAIARALSSLFDSFFENETLVANSAAES